MIIFIRLKKYQGLNKPNKIKKIFMNCDDIHTARNTVHDTFGLSDEWDITDIYPSTEEPPKYP